MCFLVGMLVAVVRFLLESVLLCVWTALSWRYQHRRKKRRRRLENETRVFIVARHLDFFEMVRNEDEKELAKRFEQVHIDTKSAGSMFEILRKKLSHSAAYPHLLSLLHHCLLLPLDLGTCPHHWLLFDRLVQQVVLQSESGEDLDIGPVEINVKELVHLLADEEEMTKLRQQSEEMEKENTEISSRLAKKEQECEELAQEKEDLDTGMARLKEKLEKETLLNLEAQQKLSEAEYKLNQIGSSGAMMNGSLPDDAKIGLKGSPFKSSVIPPPPSLPGAPPPPPPPGPPPPPNAPRPPNAPPHPSKALPKKNIPQPSNPLKSFNWSKLPESKLDGTVWNELDDTKLFKHMDLVEVDKLFSAYQRNGADRVDGSAEDIRTLGRSKSKVLSIIDSRRAQNCTILLSKLKLSNQEIFKALYNMDRDDVLPPDMVEQLLKFVPSSEECALLEEHSGELNQMARADRFLYDLSRIPHFEQRLRTLFYKKRFPERVSEVQPRITGVLEASKETQRSKKLKKILELVLAFGNYMNRGQRGNAVGFKLPSLNRLADTKSSTNKNLTLLHYLLETINKKFKDLLKIEEDLPSIRIAAKVSMSELEKDMAALRSGLKEVEKELEFQRSTPSSTSDQYLPVMKAFHQQATLQYNQLDDLFQDMKQRYERAVRLFGEDPATMQPDEFFGIFDNFLSSFQEAYQDNDNQRRRLEEEERRRKQEEELKRRTLEKKNSRRDNPNGICNGNVTKVSRVGVQEKDKGEFDDLISALRTGDVFGDDIAKFKRNRKRISGTGSSPPRITSLRDNSRERVLANGKA